MKKKYFYTLRKYCKKCLRDLIKWLFLVSSGVFIRKEHLKISKAEGGMKHLVILRPDGIGDFVVFARELHRYRMLYPSTQWNITLIGNKVWQALAEDWNSVLDDKWFDDFVSIDRGVLRKSIAGRKQIVLKLKRLCCDELIYPVHSRDIWGCIFAKWINARIKIAPFGDSANLFLPFKYFFDRTFTHLIPEMSRCQLEVDRADYFLRELGDLSPSCSCLSSLPVTAKMIEEKEEVLSIAGLRIFDPYVVIFPGASWAGKRWPVAHFSEWGQFKTKKTGLNVLICGGPCESQLGQTVVDAIGANAYNLAGKTTLIGLAGLLAGATECIGNDTAAVHLSAAFERPTTCVMGGGHCGRFWPYGDLEINKTISHRMPCFGCDWECRYKAIPVPCIDAAVRCSD